MAALIRFYFGVDPSKLKFDEFANLWGELEFALKVEGKITDVTIRHE